MFGTVPVLCIGSPNAAIRPGREFLVSTMTGTLRPFNAMKIQNTKLRPGGGYNQYIRTFRRTVCGIAILDAAVEFRFGGRNRDGIIRPAPPHLSPSNIVPGGLMRNRQPSSYSV